MRSTKKVARISGPSAAARRIAEWRKTGRGGARMPETLWRDAEELPGFTKPTVRALKIDYERLMKRVVAAAGVQAAVPGIALAGPRPTPAFIDVGRAGEIR
ncbi:MAG TPA: hypothetical protein VKP30_08830 [Polyangiaceae bacterium]|nr:hypothetical protein [Polyangiaceae bacterium]